MNIKVLAFRILLILNIVSYAYSEKKRQLMSDSEIIASIDENISLLLKFARIIFIKKSEQAKKKCAIALKNLKTLNSATENGSIRMNPLTSITLNGIIWHPDPCNNPNQIIKHIELYNLIKLSKVFNQISNFNQKSNNNEHINIRTSNTKSSFSQNDLLRNTAFRSNAASNPFIKHKTSTKTISQGILSKMDSLVFSGNYNNCTTANLTLNTTNILDTDDKLSHRVQNNTGNNSCSGRNCIRMELEELARMKPVSSKSSSGFSESLCRILSERGAS
ncbi:uncharacterized protein ELE39_001674 [Cryptosporidium sp. chipmunk genotype I]|uniref:uncharacterized protein n=1 Tax=Cryptosporidium sp. chipmunk genotype I TaxID=1280935 RepID=UPI00351A3CFE|nr:hypothetical protein ELE39_001674 [Cryptosporidium sp. chipmunk genotype I]